MAVGTLANIKVDPVAGTFSAKYTVDGTATATSVFCGFTPRVVKLTQIAGTLGALASTVCYESMAAGTNGNLSLTYHATGAVALVTANGITFLSGTESTTAAAATGASALATAGMGFSIGTAVASTTQVLLVEAYR